jgi:hypothetical protein
VSPIENRAPFRVRHANSSRFVHFGRGRAGRVRLHGSDDRRPQPARARGCFSGYGDLVPDPNGVLDLPAGFQYRVFSRGAVLRQAIEGGAPMLIATEQFYPAALAVSEQYVYWLNATNSNTPGAVMKAKR